MVHQTVFSKISLPIILQTVVMILVLMSVLGCSNFSNEDLVDGMCSNALLNECHEHADCTVEANGAGYQCRCKEGWVGDGRLLCEDINECDDPEQNPCPAKSDCVNIPEGGGYRCDCPKGFEIVGELCQDIDECADDTLNDCPEDTVCRNLEGEEEYECTWMVTEQVTCEDSATEGTDDAIIQIEDNCYSILNDPSATALYFNRCDDKEDFTVPDQGSEYDPTMLWEMWGGASGYTFETARFDNGLKVRCRSRKANDFGRILITPFLSDMPDLSRGTVTFWGKAEGDMAGAIEQIPIYGEADKRVFVESHLWFHLTDQVYVHLYGPGGEKKDTFVSLVIDGEPMDSVTLTESGLAYFTLQWDTIGLFSDNTNVRLFIDGGEPIASFSNTLADNIGTFDQNFELKSITTYVGKENQSFMTGLAAENAGVYLDNIIIWNEIVPIGDLF